MCHTLRVARARVHRKRECYFSNTFIIRVGVVIADAKCEAWPFPYVLRRLYWVTANFEFNFITLREDHV